MGLFDLLGLSNNTSGGRGSVSIDTERLIRAEWEKIDSLLKGGAPSQLRQALISADKTLDNALREVVSGESMGERLKNAKNTFDVSQYQRIWNAHKVRNNLVHESGYEPPYFVVKEAIATLREGLDKLGVRI